MRKSNLGNKHFVYRLQIIFGALVVLFPLLTNPAQGQLTYNQPFYDYSRTVHFGFGIGTNFSRFHYELSDNFYENDTLSRISHTSYPGLSLSAISNWHVTERFNLRFVPTLSLNQRNFDYYFEDGTTEDREIESVLVEFPLTAKYKATRHADFRFYILGGGKYSYDFASEADAAVDPRNPIVAVKPHQFSFEFGLGFDFYFTFFKFSPELKISHGVNDVLAPDQSLYSNVFESLYTRFFYINLNFEG